MPERQVVGAMKEETSVRQVMYDMQVELADTLERLSKTNFGG